jgi:hypothetical protein
MLAYTFVDIGMTETLFAGAANFNTRPLVEHESPITHLGWGKIPRLLDPAPSGDIL